MSHLTIFSCPKAFTGEFERIQNLAIESWKALGADIVLVGDDAGIEDAAKQHGAYWAGAVVRNQYGTPLLSDIFEMGQRHAQASYVAYVNTDIILFEEFNQAVYVCVNQLGSFLMSGQRFDFDYDLAAIDHDRSTSLEVRRGVYGGHWLGPHGADYFVFEKWGLGAIPPFAVGRFRTDNWLMWRALSRNMAFVDATEAVMAVHQPHGYNHVPGEVERFMNDALVGTDGGELRRLFDSTHYLTADFELRERVKA